MVQKCHRAKSYYAGLDMTLRGQYIYTSWEYQWPVSLQWPAFHTLHGWGEATNPLSSACFPAHCHIPSSVIFPFHPLNKGTLNLLRELYVWVNVAVYHFHAVNYFVREIYRYPRMFGLGAPVHLEINKLFLEIPFVSQYFAQRTLLGVNIQGDLHS